MIARSFRTRLRGMVLPVVLVTGLLLAVPAMTDNGYRLPTQSLIDMVDAPPTPQARLGPDGEWLLLRERLSLPSIAELAEPELRLAGLRIKPAVDGRSRVWPYAGFTLVRIDDGLRRPITGLPAQPRLGEPDYSPDGTLLAFTHTRPDGIELWVAEVATGKARKLSDVRVHTAGGIEPAWLADSRTIVCAAVPADRGAPPVKSAVPSGPVIQQNLGKKAPARTYQDLLENPHDEALFEHHLQAHVTLVGLDGTVTRIGAPGVLWDINASPDGQHLVVETLHRPFSYLVPASRFPRRIEVLDRTGAVTYQVADLPLHDQVPTAFGSVATGPRSVRWRADAAATLVWTEALDGGDAGKEAEHRDQLFLHPAPFDGEPTPWITLRQRFGGIQWSSDDLALISDWWWKTRTVRTLRARPGDPATTPEVLVERSWEDRYNDPGEPLSTWNDWGRRVLRTDAAGRTIYRIGDGASPEGDRPFLDAFDLESGKTQRLFHSAAPFYERPVTVLDAAAGTILTRRESIDEPPNYFVRKLSSGDRDPLERLTDLPHPTPQLLGIQKELIRYTRADGVELTATPVLAAGLRRRAGPAADADVGVSAGVQECRRRRPGHRFAVSLRAHRLVVVAVVAGRGLRGARRSGNADRR